MNRNVTAKAARCQYCGRAWAICCCDLVEVIQSHTKITVWQDQRETKNKKNTLLLAQQCLPNLAVCQQLPDDLSNTGLLWPNAHSQALETSPERPARWLLLDGSWNQAKACYLANPRLQRLPSFHFAQPPSSQYHIRKRPHQDGLASIEAIAYLLSVVEPTCQWQVLTRLMITFNQRWLAQVPPALQHRYQR